MKQHAAAIRSEVRTHRGGPVLFVNGRPHTGLTFMGADNEIRMFADAGVGCVCIAPVVAQTMQEDGTCEYGRLRDRLNRILSQNPDALVIVRMGLDTYKANAPSWWRERYDSEMQLCLGPDGNECRPRFSFSSRRWREDMTPAMVSFIGFCEENYADHVMAYQIGAGASGEWAYSWWNELGDFGPLQTDAFRGWLRQKYRDDEGSLREAWHDTGVSFETVEVPRDRARTSGQSSFHDPLSDGRLIDYMTFHSEVVADAICHYARAAKQALVDLGRTKVLGTFYGYHFKRYHSAMKYCSSGHFAQDRILDNPDIDFVVAPYAYDMRYEGGAYQSQLAPAGLRLHGKFFYSEDDTFTHLAAPQPHRNRCANAQSSLGVLRRNWAGVMREGGSQWWFECYSKNWYEDEVLMRGIGEMQALSEKFIDRDRTTCAQVAVLVSDLATPYVRMDDALIDASTVRQMAELSALGAPFDTYRLEDLPLLVRSPWFANYRLVVLLNAYMIPDDTGEMLRRSVATGGRTLLWLYGAGFVTGQGLAAQTMTAHTGIATEISWYDEPALVETSIAGTRLLCGTDKTVLPLFRGVDPGALAVGWYVASGAPGLMVRRFDTWQSVWSGAPVLPGPVLRHLARDAGVHLYTEAGHQVIAEKELLAVHAASTGRHLIRLPVPTTVRDALTDELVAADVHALTVSMARGETAVWRVDSRVP